MNEYLQIEVPGRGWVNLEAEAVNRRIQQEDANLRFGWNAENGDWVIYILMPRDFDSAYRIEGEPVYPILGFGDRIPSPDEAVARLQYADTRKHGMRILNEMNKQNGRLAQQKENAASELSAETAERVEHVIRKDGMAEKWGKVVMSVPKPEKRH